MKSTLRLFGYMRAFWAREVGAYLCMLAINSVRLVTPLLIGIVIDQGIGQNMPVVLTRSVLLLLAATMVQGLFRFGEGYLSETVSQGIAYNLRNEAYRKLQSLSFSYHDHTQTGQLLARVTSDVERLQRITGRGIIRLIDSIVLLVGTTLILLHMNALLAPLALVAMPIIMAFMKRYVDRMHPQWHMRQDETAVLTSRLEQNLRGMRVVRGFAQEGAETARFEAVNTRVFDLSMNITRAGSFAMPFVILLASVSTVLVLWLGGQFVIQGLLTLGQLVAFNTYLLQLVEPVRRLGYLITMLGESQASAERVFEILDAKSDVQDAPDAVPLGPIRGDVTFEDVSFAYADGSPVLTDLSFHVEAGQVVALLGPTGSGKSTVINLIPRFYDVTAGRVLVDGIDVRAVTLDSLRSQIGIVLQETLLFGSTIRENIAFGRPEASPEEIEAVAKAAAAHEFIMETPNGYDTAVGERGITLSGGQRQRIAIARALLLDPRILILDDATSSVDTETEQEIQRALANLMRGRTSFVIAQRVSTVRDADVILVLDHGRLVAEGEHEELIQASGVYADIYYRQLRQEDGARTRRVALAERRR